MKKKKYLSIKEIKKIKSKSGFTLIELLVVIAIIGVLSSVVLGSLGNARNAAKYASIKSSLSSMRAQAELSYLENGDYTAVCDVGTQGWNIFYSAIENVTISTSTNLACYDENGIVYVNANNITATPASSTSGSGIDSNGSAWAVSLPLSDGTWFCVDSSGRAIERSGRGLSSSGPDKTC